MGSGQLRPQLATSQNVYTTWPFYVASLLGFVWATLQHNSGNWVLKAGDPRQSVGSNVTFMA